MFPQISHPQITAPAFFASFLCLRIQLCLVTGRGVGEAGVRRRVDEAARALADAAILARFA